MKPIEEVITEHHLPVLDYDLYTKYIAKIKQIQKRPQTGKLIVVTGMNPNPAGEGKTTSIIGLVDALNNQNCSTIGVIREPSMGPVFGMKGTGSGANEAMLVPFDKINLHFTGDFHAITSANNLIAAVLDNEVYFHSDLQIDPTKIFWKRCLDVNDRSLREIQIGNLHTGFNITAASDLMALFCLAHSEEDFLDRLDETIVANSVSGQPIRIRDLQLRSAIKAIMHEAFDPNLVQTKFGSPFFVHGGPFANIAHGTSSVIAGNMAMEMADFVVTECGFGADLGFEKFCNIVCPSAGWVPNLVCLVISLKSIHAHGQDPMDLQSGFANIMQHLNHIKNYNLPSVCLVNLRPEDLPEEREKLFAWLDENKIAWAPAEAWAKGGMGMMEAATLVRNKLVDHPNFTPLYKLSEPVTDKLTKIISVAYGGQGFQLSEIAKQKLDSLKRQDYYICVAKTPYSLSDNPKLTGCPHDFKLLIRDIEVNEAANLLIILAGTVYRIPGLTKVPAAKNFVLK